jgi:hypothetical protein
MLETIAMLACFGVAIVLGAAMQWIISQNLGGFRGLDSPCFIGKSANQVYALLDAKSKLPEFLDAYRKVQILDWGFAVVVATCLALLTRWAEPKSTLAFWLAVGVGVFDLLENATYWMVLNAYRENPSVRHDAWVERCTRGFTPLKFGFLLATILMLVLHWLGVFKGVWAW